MSKQTHLSNTTADMKKPPFSGKKAGYGRTSTMKTLEGAAKEGDYKMKMEDLRNTMTPAMRASTLMANPFFKGYPDHGMSDNRASVDGKVYMNRRPKCTCGRSVFNDKYV